VETLVTAAGIATGFVLALLLLSRELDRILGGARRRWLGPAAFAAAAVFSLLVAIRIHDYL
jgi:hypothetical protein